MGVSGTPRRWTARLGNTELRLTSPAPRAMWRQVFAGDPTALPSQSPEWLDCVCASGMWRDASRLYERDGDRPLVLPMVVRSRNGGRLSMEASLPPGWGPGGILAPGGPRVDDVRAVAADVAGSHALQVTIRPGFRTGACWAESGVPGAIVVPRVVHVLDLEGGFDKVWSQRFTAETRKGLRRAERRAEQAGVTVECGNSPALVADFYNVYLRWLEGRARQRPLPGWAVRWGGRHSDPRRKFELVAGALGDACLIYVARLDDRPVAADFSVRHEGNMVTWRGMSDGDAGARLRLNELLLQMSIQGACEQGCRYYEMGESGGVASLERFKLRLGARPVPLAEYRLERLPLTTVQTRVTSLRRGVERAASRAREIVQSSPESS